MKNYKSVIGSSVVGASALGAGLIYFLDRQAGKRRRAAVRDKAVHGLHAARDASGKVSRDLRNRAQGVTVGIKRTFSKKEEVPDSVLSERVRSNIGRAVSHPGSIQVEAANGHVKLTGVILAAELDDLLREARSTPGVRDVVHDLQIHQEPSIPALQGEGSRGRFGLARTHWSPAARVFTGFAGGALIAYGLVSRKAVGAAAAIGGLPLLARAATNLPFRRMMGLLSRPGVDIQKSININAPVEKVFDLLRRVEDFPTFMTHVKKVSKIDENRYRWTLSGPAGVETAWDSAFTSIIPNRRIAWKSEKGSAVKHAGIAELGTNPDGSTAVHVRLAYNPLIGDVGHALITVLGADPKTILDEDLMRLKTFMETGKQPHDAAATRRS